MKILNIVVLCYQLIIIIPKSITHSVNHHHQSSSLMLPSSFKQTNPSDSDETQAPVRESDSNNNSAIFDFLLLFSFLIAQLSRAGEHKRGHRYIPNSKSGVTLLVGTTTHMICLHLQPSTPKSLMFWRFQQLSVFILYYSTKQ